MFQIVLMLLAIVLVGAISDEGRLQMDMDIAPEQFDSCEQTLEEIEFYENYDCSVRGRSARSCVLLNQIMLETRRAWWDAYCASQSASPSSSPDASFDGECECLTYRDYQANIFTVDDATLSSDSEGAVLVGGSATFRGGFSVGIEGITFPGAAVVVGGDLNYATGSVLGDLEVGGAANVGPSITHRANTSVASSVTYDFASAEAHYRNIAANLCSKTPTGTVELEYNSLYVRRGNAQTEVFELHTDQLAAAKSIDFSGISESATVVVNIRGEEATLSTNIIGRNKVRTVFNFCEARHITLQQVQMEGSILAMDADIIGNGGVINGQVIAKSFSGSTQFNNFPCVGCL